MLNSQQIPTPKILALLNYPISIPGLSCLNGEVEIRNCLSDPKICDVFIKPVHALRGWGALSLGKRLENQLAWKELPGGDVISIEEVLSHISRSRAGGGYIVQELAKPHPIFSQMAPDILHTLRIVTHMRSRSEVIAATLKVGRGNRPADNPLGRGGLVANGHLDSGVCQRPFVVEGMIPIEMDDHPVSGTRITGGKIPFWQDILSLVNSAAEHLWFLNTLGWDVGITSCGPIIIEANCRYDINLLQISQDWGILNSTWAHMISAPVRSKTIGLIP